MNIVCAWFVTPTCHRFSDFIAWLIYFLPTLPFSPLPSLPCQERDVTIVQLYGQLYISVLRQQPRVTSPSPSGSTGAEIVLCQMLKDGQIRKTDVMRLDMNGRFAISVVDNLVIVHIQVGGEERWNVIARHESLAYSSLADTRCNTPPSPSLLPSILPSPFLPNQGDEIFPRIRYSSRGRMPGSSRQ